MTMCQLSVISEQQLVAQVSFGITSYQAQVFWTMIDFASSMWKKYFHDKFSKIRKSRLKITFKTQLSWTHYRLQFMRFTQRDKITVDISFNDTTINYFDFLFAIACSLRWKIISTNVKHCFHRNYFGINDAFILMFCRNY